MPLALALDQVDAWLASPSLVLVAGDENYCGTLKLLVIGGRINSPRIHDARVATLCRRAISYANYGPQTADFSRFSDIQVTNQLV